MSPYAWVALFFVAGLLLSTAVVVAVLLCLSTDHFVRHTTTPRHIALIVLKNLLGLVLVAVGLVLSLPGVPGQGLLTIFAGILLIDVPGKRRLELAILRRPTIRKGVDRLRARFKRAPLLFPGE